MGMRCDEVVMFLIFAGQDWWEVIANSGDIPQITSSPKLLFNFSCHALAPPDEVS
jgi:hypothetical protein